MGAKRVLVSEKGKRTEKQTEYDDVRYIRIERSVRESTTIFIDVEPIHLITRGTVHREEYASKIGGSVLHIG